MKSFKNDVAGIRPIEINKPSTVISSSLPSTTNLIPFKSVSPKNSLILQL